MAPAWWTASTPMPAANSVATLGLNSALWLRATLLCGSLPAVRDSCALPRGVIQLVIYID